MFSKIKIVYQISSTKIKMKSITWISKEGSASEGEVTLGGNSGDRPRIREPGIRQM